MDARKEAKQAEDKFWIARRDHYRARHRTLEKSGSRSPHQKRTAESALPGVWFDITVIVAALTLGISYAVAYGF